MYCTIVQTSGAFSQSAVLSKKSSLYLVAVKRVLHLGRRSGEGGAGGFLYERGPPSAPLHRPQGRQQEVLRLGVCRQRHGGQREVLVQHQFSRPHQVQGVACSPVLIQHAERCSIQVLFHGDLTL